MRKWILNPIAILAMLCVAPEIWAQTQAYYRHHQLSSTTSLEASLVNREIGIDASARNCLVGKKADGTAIHAICRETDTASLSGVLNVTGQINGTSALRLSLYNQHSIPFFGSGGLVSEDASNLTFNDATNTLATRNLTLAGSLTGTTGSFSSTLGATGQITAAGGINVTGGSNGVGRILYDAAEGLMLRGNTGSSRDFALYSQDAGLLFSNPTGTRNLTVGHSSGTTTFPGAVSLSGNNLTVARSNSSGTVSVDVQNSATTSGSSARLQAQVASGTAGDPYTHYSISGVQEWATGPDNSDGDAYVITPGATPGATTNGLRISTAGAVTVPGTLGVTGVTTATGGLTLGARFIDATTSVSGNTTLGTTHSTIFASAGGGSITLTLPAASGNTGLTYTIFKTDASSTNTVTVDGNGSDLISGALTVVLCGNADSRLTIISNGSNWFIKELYEEGTFTITMTGMSGTVTGTARFIRNQKSVTLQVPALTGTSNSTSSTLTGTPSALLPARDQYFPIKGMVTDNGVNYGSGLTPFIRVTSGGIDFASATDGSSAFSVNGFFTASGTKALNTLTITYSQL